MESSQLRCFDEASKQDDVYPVAQVRPFDPIFERRQRPSAFWRGLQSSPLPTDCVLYPYDSSRNPTVIPY
jgi:hypothetical protein